jgi:hypothetical protein
MPRPGRGGNPSGGESEARFSPFLLIFRGQAQEKAERNV